MCGVSLTDKKHREVVYTLLGIERGAAADVVRSGRLRWFGYLRMNGCRSVEMWRGWGEMSCQAKEDSDRVCE